jgi:hypothetical protein
VRSSDHNLRPGPKLGRRAAHIETRRAHRAANPAHRRELGIGDLADEGHGQMIVAGVYQAAAARELQPAGNIGQLSPDVLVGPERKK